MKFKVIVALTVSIYIVTAYGVAEDFSALKAKYLTLRNTDPDLEKSPDWEELAHQFERYAKDYSRSTNAPSALFNSAILYESLFEKFGDEEHLDKSLEMLSNLSHKYKKSPLADDALVKQGDLLLNAKRDRNEAKAKYQAVLDDYKDADLYEMAKDRLARLEKAKPLTSASNEHEESQQISSRENGPTVIIDPGHGGEDFGAIGQGGLLEKDVVLDVGLRLESILLKNLRAKVRLTRRSDVFVPLAERIGLANELEADMFVSLHTNASPKAKLSGLETYYLDNTGDVASKKLAERENESLAFEGAESDLQFMLSDLIQTGKAGESLRLSNILQKSLISYLQSQGIKVKDVGVRKGPFYVLVGAHMPSVLIELLFIDNEHDGKRLADKNVRNEIAFGLYQGIASFLKSKP